MNPVEMLKTDHRKVERLFGQYRQPSDGRQKQQIDPTVTRKLQQQLPKSQ